MITPIIQKQISIELVVSQHFFGRRENMKLIPKINGNMHMKDEVRFSINETITIGNDLFDDRSIEIFSKRMMNKCNIPVLEVDLAKDADIQLLKDVTIKKHGYSIDVSEDQIKIISSDNEGVNNALTTLFVMIVDAVKHSDRRINGVKFSDFPKYHHRGLHVDVSRHFFGADVMKKIIEEMALNKLNVLHWHLTDDQGWRIQSKVYPALTVNQEHYTQEEIKDILVFAEARGVEVIPEIDMPGHATAMLLANPELSCFGEKVEMASGAGIFKTVLCPGKESTYTWLFKLLDEMAALFPSKRFHIGGDEVPNTNWKKCPHCSAAMKKNNIDQYADLQYVFTKRITDYFTQHGKEVICWNETLHAKNVDESITTQYWIELTEDSYCKPYFEKGYKGIFSEVFSLYFDYPYSVVPLKKTYEYEPNPLLNAANVLGIEGAIWTERVPTPEILEYMISPRINALAESAWTFDRNYEDFLTRLKAYKDELKLITLNSAPWEAATISGDAAKEEAKAFMMMMFQFLQNSDIDMGLSESEMKAMMSKFLTNVLDEETATEILNQFM